MDDKNMARAVSRKRSRQIKIDHSANDQLSQLPTELLLIILSFLTFEDAAILSKVSRRWRNLWRQVTGRLNLDIPDKVKMIMWRDYMPAKALEYTIRVNKALQLHQGPYLDELRIGAFRDACVPSQVCSWIGFAIRQGVKVLDLNFNPAGSVTWPKYTFFGVENLTYSLDEASERRLHHSSRVNPAMKHQFRSFCCLKSLSLGFIDISDEVIHYFLLNCMFLERLRVECSDILLNVEVADGLQLKCLEIIRCGSIRNLNIYSKNLVSLAYIGPNIAVPFKSVPLNPLKLTIGNKYGESFAFEQSTHSFYLSQLESLKFEVPYQVHATICRVPHMFEEMINLKHLELQIPIGKSLMGYTAFLIASPVLSTFKMEYRLMRSFTESVEEYTMRKEADKYYEERKVPHQHLGKIELIGFHDDPKDVHFAKHLITMAVCLKKMVLTFRQHSSTRAAFRNVDKKLKEILPAEAELVLQKT